MRGIFSLSVVTLAALFSAPAMAQMCGGGMQMAQAQPQAQAQGSPAQPPSDMIMGACGMGASAAAGNPTAGGSTQPRRTGMCGCCQNMAMMQGMMGRSTGAQGQQTMPGMNMPGMQMPGMQMPAPGDAKPSEPPKQP